MSTKHIEKEKLYADTRTRTNVVCFRRVLPSRVKALGYLFFKKKRLIYCSEMYKCLHEYFIKTVPDTSLHETYDLT